MSATRKRATGGILRLLGIAAAGLLIGPGCGLILDFDPPHGQEIECFVTVVNPEGIEVDISSRTHPDFVEPSFSFGGGGGGGPSGGGTRPIRPYFTCPSSSCSAPCSVADTDAAEADFRRWLNQRITEVASAPAGDSPFSVHAGPWCIKEEDDGPSTLRCEPREELTEEPICGPALTAGPLSSCPGAVPTGTCVEVECEAVAPCTGITFPDLPVGSSTSVPVTVRNCGGPDDDFITIDVDGMILPIGALADFAVPAATNGCLPRTPEEIRDGRALQLTSVDPFESECVFEAVFQPMDPGAHEGETVFATSVDPAYRIRLDGVGLGGELSLRAARPICIVEPTTLCSTRTVRVTNGGPGAVTVDSVFVTSPGTNFSILRPPPPALPATVPVGGLVEIEIQWCSGPPDERRGELNIRSNADMPFTPAGMQVNSSCP